MRKSLRTIWPYIQPYRNRIIWIFMLGILMAALSGLVVPLSKFLLEDVLTNHDVEKSKWVPYGFPVLFLFLGITRYFHLSRLIITTELIVAGVRRKLVDQFINLNLTFHNNFQSGSGGLISRILNDTVILQQGLFHFTDLVREPITAIFLFSYMMYLDWKLTVFCILVLPVFVTFLRKIAKSLRKYSYKSREAMEDVTTTVKESLDGVRVIQAFNLESEFSKRFEANQNAFVTTRTAIISREEVLGPINEFIVALMMMCLAKYAIFKVFGGSSSPAEFIVFIAAAGGLQQPIKKIQEGYSRVQQAIAVVERLSEVLESTSRVPLALNAKPFPKDWSEIEFRNVSFSYGKNEVLKNVSLKIRKGEVVAFVGASGSGKSTLVNLLERFYDPTSGEIFIDGTRLTDFDVKDLRLNLGYVTQDVFLFRDSIERNIWAGNFSKDVSGVERAAQLANAHDFISKMPQKYKTSVGDRGSLLSGGEKQRISIARAIFKDAPILILDEATSALDSMSELEVQKGINHLMEGRTVFMIAHRLSTVAGANRIIVMKDGKIVEEGSHQQLLDKKGEYYSFHQLQ